MLWFICCLSRASSRHPDHGICGLNLIKQMVRWSFQAIFQATFVHKLMIQQLVGGVHYVSSDHKSELELIQIQMQIENFELQPIKSSGLL